MALALSATTSAQTRSVTFTVTGDTFDVSDASTIENESGSRRSITPCTVDLSPASFPGGVVFGTAGGATGNPADDTDFVAPDTRVVDSTSPSSDGLNDGYMPDRSPSFTMTFDDFDPGEKFAFGIDVADTADDAGISGNDLAGATITCTVGGTASSGRLEAAGKSPSVTLRAAPRASALSGWGTSVLASLMGSAGYVVSRRRLARR